MALYNEDTDIRQWRYIAKKIQLIASGSTVDIDPIKLKYFQIVDDFERNVFPIFKICLILESTVYYKILKNKDSGRIYLRIDAYYQKVGQDGAKSNNHEFINGNFNIVLDDNTADLLYSQKVVANTADYKSLTKDNTNVLKDIDNEITFYLFRTDAIEGLKVENVNAVLHDATVTDAIAYLSSIANLKNVLFAPPDNKTRYASLLVPPLSVLKAYLFLDLYYGIYKTGSIVYFGFDTTYIIPFSGECKAWKDGDPKKTTIIVPKTSNVAHATILGELKDSEKSGYVIADYSTLKIENQTLSNNYIAGNNAQVVDSYSGGITTATAKTVTKENKNSTRLLENTTESNYTSSMYVAQTSAQAMVVSAQMRDSLVSSFTPNREFEIVFEETKYADKYKGRYIISSATHTFSSTGESFIVDTIAKFRRADPIDAAALGIADAEPSEPVPGL